MTQRYTVSGVGLSERQAAVLCQILARGKGTMPLDGLTGWDRNALTALSDHDLVKLDDKQATITEAGRKVVIELNKRINGDSESKGPQPEKGTRRISARETSGTRASVPPADRPETQEKPTTRGPRKRARETSTVNREPRRDSRERPAPARRDSPPPTGTVDFATLTALREQIVKRYEADLAAIDRLTEIAQAVTA